MIHLQRHRRDLWAAQILVVLTLLSARVAADPDAGAKVDAGSTARRGAPDAGPDAALDLPPPGSAAWVQRQARLYTAGLARLKAEIAAADRLKAAEIKPDGVAAKLAVDLDDPGAVSRRVAALRTEQSAQANKVASSKARLAAVQPSLEAPQKRLARLQQEKLRRRWTRIPKDLPREAEEAKQRLAVLTLEHQLLSARSARLAAWRRYLERSQPARLAARKRQDDLARQNQAEREAASQARQLARTEELDAEKARREALAAQQRARSEADRQLSAERARLQSVRVKQARLKKHMARDKASLAQRRGSMERFRGETARQADNLSSLWPQTAPKYDALYDRVVAQLNRLQPEEVRDLRAALEGGADVAHPGDLLTERVRELSGVYTRRVKDLEALRASLARAAADLTVRQRRQLRSRLELLQRETSSLNERRIAMLPRLTPNKRAGLNGLTRQTLEQLNLEVTQLALDGLSWVFLRLGQIDLLPRLIRDVFTVGSLLWTLIKILALLIGLRVVLRRWDDWMRGAIRSASQTVSLGSQALRVAKLVDAVRFIGPALLTLLVVTLVYTLLGGDVSAPAELRYLYVLAFWLAVYRVAVRLVEYVAKHMGIQQAMREAGDLPLDQDGEELEGPPSPRDSEEEALTPAPALLVRSMSAAIRYVLVVILILELTSMAVGHGTIYRLTAEFSWWAAAFFAFYFLVLWRPHIERAYERLQEGKSTRGMLARLVRASHSRFYGVFVIAVALVVVLVDRIANFGRRYLSSRDAIRKLSAFFFRRQVERHAQEQGRVLDRRADLPHELLQHFPMGPLEPSAKPIRPELMDELVELFTTWQREHSDGSVAVVGRTGMGKSTVLQMVEEELRVPVFYGDVRTKITRPAKVVAWLSEVFSISPKPSSEKELIKRIREDKTQVAAVDNCHNLFLRRVGGFEGWESFLRVVNETCDNVFWILTFNQAAFDYLHAITGHANYLRRTFVLHRWSERQIRHDIMIKMRRARLGVSFSDLLMAKLQGISMSTQLGRTSSGYFRMLWDFTGGIPRLASHFWLDSLVPRTDERMVRVHLFSTPEMDELERLSTDILFVLTSIAEHENLTHREVISTTSLPADFCNFACRYCLEEGYLKLNKDTNRLRLNWRWQQPIHRFLKRQRLLSS